MARYLNTLSQAAGKNGQALVGATLGFFEAGPTTTKLDTFQDEDLTIANTNPVVADGEGRFPDIFLKPQKYFVEFKDAGGSVKDSQDNVTGPVIGSNSLENIAEMTALLKSTLLDGDSFPVDSHTTIGDGGDGRWIFVAASTETTNLGTISATDEGGTGRWKREFSGALNLLWFGIDGTLAGDTLAHDSACTVLEANGGALYIPGGRTYFFNNNNSFTKSVEIYGDGDSTNIDLTDATFSGNTLYKFSGSIAQIEELSVSPTEGDTSLTFVSAPSLSVGDVFIIFNPTNSSYSGFRTTYFEGEYCKVVNVTASVVKLDRPLYSGYTAANVDIYKMTSPSPLVRDMKIAGDVSTGLIEFELCINPKAIDLTMDHLNNSLILYDRCFGGGTTRLKGSNIGDGGDDYGINIANCQDVMTYDSNVYGRRHAINRGGGSAIGSVPPRNCNSYDTTYRNDRASGVPSSDFHGNVAECIDYDCTIFNGGSWQGKNNGYKNCWISAALNGSIILSAEILGGDMILENCECVSYADPSSGGRGMVDVGGNSSVLTANTTEDLFLRVKGTKFVNAAASASTFIMTIENDGTAVNINVDIDDIDLFGMADFVSVVQMTLNTGTADSDMIRITNIKTKATAKFLVVHSTTDYRDFNHRLEPSSGVFEGTTTATNTLQSGALAYKWKYPRVPSPTVTRSGRGGASIAYLGTFLGAPYARDVDATEIVIAISTDNSAEAFTASNEVDLHYTVEINEV